MARLGPVAKYQRISPHRRYIVRRPPLDVLLEGGPAQHYTLAGFDCILPGFLQLDALVYFFSMNGRILRRVYVQTDLIALEAYDNDFDLVTDFEGLS